MFSFEVIFEDEPVKSSQGFGVLDIGNFWDGAKNSTNHNIRIDFQRSTDGKNLMRICLSLVWFGFISRRIIHNKNKKDVQRFLVIQC